MLVPLKSLFSTPLATIVASVLTTFVIAAIFLKLGGPVPISIQQTTSEKIASFDVEGEGSVEVIPDEATALFGVTANAQSVFDLQETVNSKIKKIKDGLKKLGVDEKDIKTINYSINPNYSYDAQTPRISGYNASANLMVTFKDFKILNQAIDSATENGANVVGSLQFTLSEKTRKQAEDEARKKAIDNAKEKAKKISQAAEVSLGKIINIQEENIGGIIPFRAASGMVEEKAQTPTEVSPGVSQIKLRVKVSYELR